MGIPVAVAKIEDLPLSGSITNAAMEATQGGSAIKLPVALTTIRAESWIVRRDLASPPASPAEGDRYLVAASATGAWMGLDGRIVQWVLDGSGNGNWYNRLPAGILYVLHEDVIIYYSGSAWVDISALFSADFDAAGAAVAVLATSAQKSQNLADLGDLAVALANLGGAKSNDLINLRDATLIAKGPVEFIANTPDASPTVGMRRLIGTSPTGVWVGKSNQVAEYFSDGWHYSGAPSIGQRVSAQSLNKWLYFDGTSWIDGAAGSIFDYIPLSLHAAIRAGTDTTDLATYIAAAYADKPIIEWGNGVFHTSQSIDLTGLDGGAILGCGANYGPTYTISTGSGTRIVITSDNIPGVRLMNASRLTHVAVRYLNEQPAANTAAIGVELNNWNRGHIDDVLVSGAAISVGCPQSNAPGKSYNSFWNSKIGTVASYNASLGHFDFRPYNAGSTNIVIDNLNLNGAGSVDDFTTPGKSCTFGIKGGNLSGFNIGQVNIESLVCTGPLLDVSTGSNRFSIAGFRAETVSFEAASNTPMFNLGGSKNRCRIEDIDLAWCRWRPAGVAPSSGDALYIVKTVATKNELYAGVLIRSTCDFGGTGTRRILVNSCTDFTNSDIEIPIEDEGSQFSDAGWSDNVTVRQSPVRKVGGYTAYEKFRNGKGTNFITRYYANSAPAAADGTFSAGDDWVIRAPSVGAPSRYRCTTAGIVGSGGVFTPVERVPIVGSATYDPPSLADGVGVTTTVTVTGATLGMFVRAVSFSLDLQGITVTAWVSASNTVSVRFQNESGGVLDLGSGTLAVEVSS